MSVPDTQGLVGGEEESTNAEAHWGRAGVSRPAALASPTPPSPVPLMHSHLLLQLSSHLPLFTMSIRPFTVPV